MEKVDVVSLNPIGAVETPEKLGPVVLLAIGGHLYRVTTAQTRSSFMG